MNSQDARVSGVTLPEVLARSRVTDPIGQMTRETRILVLREPEDLELDEATVEAAFEALAAVPFRSAPLQVVLTTDLETSAAKWGPRSSIRSALQES